VGLAQREIEAAGFSTLSLSNIAALTASVGAPRVAAIERPFGLTAGSPGDRDGQLAILRSALGALESIRTPGEVVNLPFEWNDAELEAQASPNPPPPITDYLMKHPLQVMKLIKHEIPES
jgi:D-proline reductase (dithiol) PrdB